LALGLVVTFPGASASAERNELRRELEETREIAAEVSKAARRVQAENLKLRTALGREVQNLTGADITARMLRLGRLDADTARLHFTTLENRVAQHVSALNLLSEEIEQRAIALQRMPANALATLGAKAELQQFRQLHAIAVDAIEGLRELQNVEAESLALAEERLALLSSRAELRTIHDDGGFDADPKVVALRAIVSRLARDAIRLENEAGASRPKSAPDPARQRLLELQAGEAIIRSSVRVADLGLLGVQNQLGFSGDLIGDHSIPIPILREARVKLDERGAWLEHRLATLHGDRLTVQGQRELLLEQGAESRAAVASQLGPAQDLTELLDFQQADIIEMQQRLGETAASLDAEIAQREFAALRERRALPADAGHWELVTRELIRLPGMTADYWQEALADLVARVAALPARGLAALGAAILALCAALWWLYRIGLRQIAMLNPAGNSNVPLEALRRSLPLVAPVVIWIVVARTVGMAERPAWLLAGALGLLPLAGFLLHLSALLFAGGSERGAKHRRLHSLACWAVLAASAAAALGLVVRSVPVLPSVTDLVDRAGFGGLLLTALATWLLRADLLCSLRDKVEASQVGRVLTTASHVVPGLMVVAAASGLAGWTNLGWAIARGVAAVGGAAGLALLLWGVLRDLASALRRR
jgi:hypothetical protein